MAAPLRMSFLLKSSQITPFLLRNQVRRVPTGSSKCIIKRDSHHIRDFLLHKPWFKSEKWKTFGGGVVFITAGAVTVLSFGMIADALVGAVKRKLKVSAADGTVEKPNHRISREIKRSSDNTGLKLTLYQYQTCPFCCKVRAFLDYHGLSYDIVEVNSVTRKQMKWTPYPKVPVLLVDGIGENGFLQLNDSSVIISILSTYLFHRNNGSQKSLDQILKCYPTIESVEKKKTVYEFPNKYFLMYFDEEPDKNKQTYKEERKWRAWTDDSLVHVLSPNIYRTPTEALQAFQYFSKVGNWEKEFSLWERFVIVYVGSVAMYFVGKILKRRYSLEDDVRLSLYREANTWMKAKGSKRRFMGGDKPNLADLSVYGALVAIEGCEAFTDMMDNTKIKIWYDDMKDAVRGHAGFQQSSKQTS